MIYDRDSGAFKIIEFKVARVDCKNLLQTCFWSMMTDSWQCSQFTFLQEHSDVSWVFMSRLLSIFVQPEFGHLTTLKRHSGWCSLKYKLMNTKIRQTVSSVSMQPCKMSTFDTLEVWCHNMFFSAVIGAKQIERRLQKVKSFYLYRNKRNKM